MYKRQLHESSKGYVSASKVSKDPTQLPSQVPLNIDEKNSVLYHKEPPAKKSSFEKERPVRDNLGFRTMSLREPLATKNTQITGVASLKAEEKMNKRGHVSRKSWTFGLTSPLKAKTNHSVHLSNETEKIIGSISGSKHEPKDNDAQRLAHIEDCKNQDLPLYTASYMNNNENVSESGTEGHRFSLFKNRSQLSNRNISGGTTALSSTNSELSTVLPLSVPVTIIEKNGEIHKLHNDDTVMKDKSHHHGNHSKLGRKLKKIFGRK